MFTDLVLRRMASLDSRPLSWRDQGTHYSSSCDMPGVEELEIEDFGDRGYITIRGKKNGAAIEGVIYLNTQGDRVDTSHMEVIYKNGVLSFSLPKTQPKKIPVRVE